MKAINMLLLCFLSVISCAADDSKAHLFVSNLYANYQKEKMIFSFKGAGADTIFTPELLKLIRLDEEIAQGEVGYLGWDPLCDCQDVGGIKIHQIKIISKENTYYAEVRLRFPVEDRIIVLKLKPLNTRWLIEDIETKPIKSLYGYLSEQLSSNKDTSR